MLNTFSLETLQNKIPSIFAEDCAERTSDKYRHISTIKVVESLVKEGFMPTWAGQSGCRLASKIAHTKHMIRFRHTDTRPTASGLYPELVLINSHDGLSSYRLMSGVYRIVCSNGLIAGNSYEEIRIRHQGDILGDVIEGTYQVLDTSNKMMESINEMSAIKLNEAEKTFFAESAHSLRFENSEFGKLIEPIKLLSPRRYEDSERNDLFTVFNVIQENLIKGGVRGYGRNARGYIKRVSTRAVKGIDHSTAINRALWTTAEKMMLLKRA